MPNHNVKTVEVPPFDALAEEASPFGGFGPILPTSAELNDRFQKEAIDARRRIQEGFQTKLASPTETPNELDKIITSMWNSGWNPEIGNVDLFARDFGCLLTKAILELLGGMLIFRSTDDASHLSIFWADAKLEAFPFHKVLKCLNNRHGETMSSFVSGLKTFISK